MKYLQMCWDIMDVNMRIFLLMIFAGFANGGNVTSDNPPGALQGGWGNWVSCADQKRCFKERIHTCSQQADPLKACFNSATKQRVAWREELKACSKCLGEWLPRSTWTNSCQGVGCLGSYETRNFDCSSASLQPNCMKTQTRYCDETKVCDGQWASWIDIVPCTRTCDTGWQTRSRTCMKNGRPSQNCAGEFPLGYLDTVTSLCNTQSCVAAPSWGPWSQCDCAKPSNQQQQRQCTSNCPPGQPSIEYKACSQCTTTSPTTSTTSKASTTSTATTTKTGTTPTTVDSRGAKGREMATASSSSTSTQAPGMRVQPTAGDGKDRIIIIVTATAVVIFLVLIICVLVARLRRKTKPLQIHVQQQPQTAAENENRRTLLFEHTPEGVYEEMGLVNSRSGSCPNFNRALPATPSSVRHPPKPPRRNRPVSQISTHSFPDLQRSLSAQEFASPGVSPGPSPTGSFRVHQIYSNPHSGKYLKPMN